MDRRKFIASLLVSSPGILGGASGRERLYGAPASIDVLRRTDCGVKERLVLSISKSGLGPQFWQKTVAVAEMVDSVTGSPAEASDFLRSPRNYLSRYGLDGSDYILESETVRLLSVISQPEIQRALSQNDCESLTRGLILAGALDFDSSQLQLEVERSLASNAAEIRDILRQEIGSGRADDDVAFRNLLAAQGAVTDDDLAIACHLLRAEIGVAPTLVMVAVSIAVVIVTVAAVAVLWVYAGGWVWGVPNSEVKPTPPFGRLVQSSPNLMRSHERAMKIAALTGRLGMVEESMRSIIAAESFAVTKALRSAGLLDITEEKSERLAEILALYAVKAAGV